MKLKKLLSMGLVAMMAMGMLAGCGGSSEDTETTEGGEKQEAKAEGETQDVTIWYYWETEGHQVALDKVIQDYNDSQDDYEVTAKYVPFADFKKQLSIGASADELPDIAILDSPDHASYATMGIFEDLTGKFDVDNYYEGTVNSCTLDGKLYGVPFGANCLALYYNEDMLNEKGLSLIHI